MIKANEEVSQSILPKKSKSHKNSIKKFLKDKSATKNFPATGEATLSGVIIEADQTTGLAKKIHRIIEGGTLIK